MDSNHGDQFEAPFPGFLKLWQDDSWEEVTRVAIHWYIEANAQAGSIEGSIVLTQTAFELLASAVLVENHGWLSTDGYEKLAAADLALSPSAFLVRNRSPATTCSIRCLLVVTPLVVGSRSPLTSGAAEAKGATTYSVHR